MHWTHWISIPLATFLGLWLTFDGARALTGGDYVTASSGPRAGQLGPWASVLHAVSINPRSTPIKLAHVAIGVAWLASAACTALRLPVARPLLIASSIASLWYLPFGTVIGLAQLAILFLASPARPSP